ncbi:MAG TPA: tetratricopeptide repeat protein [Myxococcota bacterium]|nr:tetratricopeptide repeat protein [Myxococcota bacterium]HRY96314.1 tetratricopeptide repeat protein [Myxococcota bacterium]HSA20804.1 tetratricopeptide repeat protein [Myxococcota bacterium]
MLSQSVRQPVLCVFLAAVVLWTGLPALAQPVPGGGKSGTDLLQEAKILYDNLQYKEALDKLKEAIRTKGNSRANVTEIYKLMGFIYIIQNQKTNARRAFELLLKIDPNFEMNPLLTSPKMLDFFNEVKNEQKKKDRVIMQHTPVTESPGAARVEVKAYVVDLQKKLKGMKLYFRKRGDPNFAEAEMAASRDVAKGAGSMTFVGAIPFVWEIYEETELFIDYYIAGLDDRGNWVANAGSPKEPFTFRMNLMTGELPEGARKTPLVKSWWFWTLIGAAVAGLGVGLYFGIDAALQEPPPPTTGQAVLVFQ